MGYFSYRKISEKACRLFQGLTGSYNINFRENPVDTVFGLKVLQPAQLEEALKPLFLKYSKKGHVGEIKQAIISQAISYLEETLNLTKSKLEGIKEECWPYSTF